METKVLINDYLLTCKILLSRIGSSTDKTGPLEQ